MTDREPRWHDLGEFIREQRRVGHLSLRKLSEMAGISNPYLSQIERGLRKPSAEILQQIARALEISSETLYIRAGILEAHDGDTDLVFEIRRDPWLDEEQKKTLVQIYESFRADRRAAGFGPDASVEGDDTPDGGIGRGEEPTGHEDGDRGGDADREAEPDSSDDDGVDRESEPLAGR